MKKTLFLVLASLLLACNDGDLQIEQVDFDTVNVSTCGNLDDATETTFFFKINQDEALLLNLASGLLKNETSTSGALTSTIPSPSDLIYRLFSDNVTQAYFCDVIPPLEPTVMQENTATTGDIAVETKVNSATKDVKTYRHTISITGLSLTNDKNESLTDNTTFEYGTFDTSTANSAKLETPFSNYEAISDFSECLDPLSDDSIRLYKTINDEFISLDIPIDSLSNIPTEESLPRIINLEKSVFKYVVLDTLATTEMACINSTLSEEIESWHFDSTSGVLNIETLENDPDEEGNISYTHTFTLENLVLTLKGDGADVKDVVLNEIENVNMGSYTTFAN